MTAALAVHQVPEGSVLVFSGVQLTRDTAEALKSGIERKVGHSRFAVLVMPPDGTVEVWGPDTDLEAKIRELLP